MLVPTLPATGTFISNCKYPSAKAYRNRLKIALDLPPIEPRPPIPPRIYKRLYTHLSNILPSSAPAGRTVAGRRTPNSKIREVGSSPASGSRVPSRATPTKERSLAQFRTPSKADPGTPTKSTGKKTAITPQDGIHPWIQPTARFLCQETDQKKLAPTIFAGMESIVAPNGRRTADEWVLGNITGLLAAFYFSVTAKARELTSEGTGKEYNAQRKEIIALLTRARKEVTISGLDDDSWDGWRGIKVKDFDEAVSKVNDSGWLAGDWYHGIADIIQTNQRSYAADTDMLDGDEAAANMQIKRADTMFQDKYDYLSEGKRLDYALWKKSILAKIESRAAGTAMEIDTQ